MFAQPPRTLQAFVALCFALACWLAPGLARAADPGTIDKDADAALASLYQDSVRARDLQGAAKGLLVFPKIVKAGIVLSGQGGDGVLIKGGQKVAYYSSSGASIGLMAGAQSYGYVLLFTSDAALQAFEKSDGFEVGVGPTVVVVNAGAGGDLNTQSGKSEVYAFVFGQKGLMAGVDLQGTKITKMK